MLRKPHCEAEAQRACPRWRLVGTMGRLSRSRQAQNPTSCRQRATQGKSMEKDALADTGVRGRRKAGGRGGGASVQKNLALHPLPQGRGDSRQPPVSGGEEGGLPAGVVIEFCAY